MTVKKISQYPDASPISLTDRLLGTDTNNGNATKNFSISELIAFVNNQTTLTSVLYAESTALTQYPSGKDIPLQIEAGAAQGTTNDPVMIAADGTITFNQVGLYVVNTAGLFSRASSGGTAILHFRGLLDGNQIGATQSIEIATSGMWIPYERTNLIAIDTAGTELTFEIARDDAGQNDGGLEQSVVSVGLGWNPSPSFVVSIQKLT
jgi:hypothetical protein